jgi:hypothetical protein
MGASMFKTLQRRVIIILKCAIIVINNYFRFSPSYLVCRFICTAAEANIECTTFLLKPSFIY